MHSRKPKNASPMYSYLSKWLRPLVALYAVSYVAFGLTRAMRPLAGSLKV
jgi:hypothetical protein